MLKDAEGERVIAKGEFKPTGNGVRKSISLTIKSAANSFQVRSIFMEQGTAYVGGIKAKL